MRQITLASGEDEADLNELERGTAYEFRDLERAAIPRNVAGVYTVWDAEQFIYVGIGGTKIVYREPTDETAPPKPVKGSRTTRSASCRATSLASMSVIAS